MVLKWFYFPTPVFLTHNPNPNPNPNPIPIPIPIPIPNPNPNPNPNHDPRSAHFETIMSKDKYEQARAAGNLRFSYRAMQAALLINLYQEEPILNQASQLLRALVDIDELMTMWRQRHALMVHRMLGTFGFRSFQKFPCTARHLATHNFRQKLAGNPRVPSLPSSSGEANEV